MSREQIIIKFLDNTTIIMISSLRFIILKDLLKSRGNGIEGVGGYVPFALVMCIYYMLYTV